MSNDLIEKVAKAIRDDPNQPCTFQGECTLGDLCFCVSSARAAIAAIDASSTHRVVPVEATDYMQQAAFDVLFGAVVSSANLQPMWDAMLAAIPKGDALDDE